MAEELLAVPKAAKQTEDKESLWTVVAINERVNRGWCQLIKAAASNAASCYDYLRTTPMVRRPGRIFPLRGKRYKGAWEYELTSGTRVFYVPDPVAKKVSVYFAGPHPPEAQMPPE